MKLPKKEIQTMTIPDNSRRQFIHMYELNTGSTKNAVKAWKRLQYRAKGKLLRNNPGKSLVQIAKDKIKSHGKRQG